VSRHAVPGGFPVSKSGRCPRNRVAIHPSFSPSYSALCNRRRCLSSNHQSATLFGAITAAIRLCTDPAFRGEFEARRSTTSITRSRRRQRQRQRGREQPLNRVRAVACQTPGVAHAPASLPTVARDGWRAAQSAARAGGDEGRQLARRQSVGGSPIEAADRCEGAGSASLTDDPGTTTTAFCRGSPRGVSSFREGPGHLNGLMT
jgi:hypothetical protein